jgi:hypothetical protein
MMSAEDFTDPHWVDEIPDVECDWCGFVECACDELFDAHEAEQMMIEDGR